MIRSSAWVPISENLISEGTLRLAYCPQLKPIRTVKRLPSWISVLPSLVVPVCMGFSLYLGLQYLIDTQVITDDMTLRYLVGHPVSKITVAMFLVGVSSQLVLGWNIFGQFSGENNISLGEPNAETDLHEVREQAVDHGQFLLDLPDRYHNHYLWDRLVAAVHSIYRTGSTASVEDELKYLSDIEQERQQQRYSLVRILIWATPMLGFLGTVLGISQALGGIAIGPDNDFQEMMNGLRGSLYIAFDTTALALTLSMLMMFGLFLVERFDSQLLRLVDQRAHSEIAKHYEIKAGGSFDSVQVVEAIQNVVVSQTEIWRESIRKAEQAWTSTLTQTSDIVRGQLSESLDENIAAMAHYLGEAIEKADMSIGHRWSQWQVSLSENARLMEQHLLTLGVQTKSVQKIVDNLDESTAFEQAMEHQQNAVMATTRTHRVLNELLEKVQEAKLFETVLEPASRQPESNSLLVEDIVAGLKATVAEQNLLTTESQKEPAAETVVAEPMTTAAETLVAEPMTTAAETLDADQQFDEAEGETIVLIFTPGDADDSDQVQETPSAESEIVGSPQMKIYQSEEEDQDEVNTSSLIDANPITVKAPVEVPVAKQKPVKRKPIIVQKPVVVEKPVVAQKPVAAPTPATEPTLNQSRSAKIARALAEGKTGDVKKPSVAFRAKFQKPDDQDGKRAA